MKTKMFEIRDEGTFIPVICIDLTSFREFDDMQIYALESYLMGRLGFLGNIVHTIQLIWMSNGTTHSDPFKWNDRTMYTAHDYIEKNWDDLKTGEVIDVEFILGESKTKKYSEQFTDPYAAIRDL